MLILSSHLCLGLPRVCSLQFFDGTFVLIWLLLCVMRCQSCFNAVFGILLENRGPHTGGISNTKFSFETRRETDYLEGLMLRFIHSSMALQPFVGPWPLLQFRNLFTQAVGLYLHSGQHKLRINAYTDIHALSGIRTHDTSLRASATIDRIFRLK
jgi:hypothetical protein